MKLIRARALKTDVHVQAADLSGIQRNRGAARSAKRGLKRGTNARGTILFYEAHPRARTQNRRPCAGSRSQRHPAESRGSEKREARLEARNQRAWNNSFL